MGSALLLVIYGISYVTTVNVGTTLTPNRRKHPIQVLYRDPVYRTGGALASVFFRPAHHLDRLARAGRWSAPAWENRHWSYRHHPRPARFTQQPHGAGMRFRVEDPGTAQVWTMRFSPAINFGTRPILSVRYRATNTDPTAQWYMLWLDDGTGPDNGGLTPFRLKDVRADGQVHILTCDIRTLEPNGNIFFFAVGVAADARGGAVFDLLDIRFDPVAPPARR